MKDPIYFPPMTEYKSFFKNVKAGDIIQYSFYYSFSQIESIVKDYGISIKRLSPHTKEYQIFGSCLFRVVGKHGLESDLKPLEPTMFDPKMLDL